MEKYLNKDVEVLIEETKDGYSYGHTSNYLYVKVKGDYPKEDMITVNITDIEYPYVIGVEK